MAAAGHIFAEPATMLLTAKVYAHVEDVASLLVMYMIPFLIVCFLAHPACQPHCFMQTFCMLQALVPDLLDIAGNETKVVEYAWTVCSVILVIA
jgi:hypothetical protein